MQFADYMKIYVPKINNAIKSIYDRKINQVENPFLKDYYTELRDYFLAGGKRIRPLLGIATYNAFSRNDDNIIVPCVGVEFLHNASLVHDDIIDKDDFRRGKPAFHYRFRQYHSNYNLKKMIAEDFGTNIGIIGGDSAFFLGLEPFLYNDFKKEFNLKAIELYKKAFIEISDGVLIEIDMVNQKDLTMEDYIKMVSLKTGALIEKSMLIGATYAGVDEINPKLMQHISTFGKNIGIIFQIIDDILGTFGDAKKTGKPTDGDIREGKKTCLLITAYETLCKEDQRELTGLIENPNMTESDVNRVKDLFQEANAAKVCQRLADMYYTQATVALEEIRRYSYVEEWEFFSDVLDFVVERTF